MAHRIGTANADVFGKRLLVGLPTLILLAACSAPAAEDLDKERSALGTSSTLETYNGVTAHAFDLCAPVYAQSGSDAHYGPPGVYTDSCGFQCVELAVRYFHFNEGIPAGSWHVGAAIEMCGNHPRGVSVIDWNATRPRPGDLVVLRANDPAVGTGAAGHVAVIRRVNADGSLDTFNQRWGSETTAFAYGLPPSAAACYLRSTQSVTMPSPPRPSGCGAIASGHGLGPGNRVTSCDGHFALVMQIDGNLVLYEHARPLWSSETNDQGGYAAIMQTDGNLVVYTRHAQPIWASNTNGHPGSALSLQNDGNAVIRKDEKPIWATNTCCH